MKLKERLKSSLNVSNTQEYVHLNSPKKIMERDFRVDSNMDKMAELPIISDRLPENSFEIEEESDLS